MAPRIVHADHLAGEVFRAFSEPSHATVLHSDLFDQNEKCLLSEKLRRQEVCFSCHEISFRVFLRALWQPEASMRKPKSTALRDARRGRYVLLLPALSGQSTGAWSWAKLARPLFKKGFSVLMIDTPDAGSGSRTGGCKYADPGTSGVDSWRARDADFLLSLLEKLKISKCHFVALGDACNLVLRLMQTMSSAARPHLALGEIGCRASNNRTWSSYWMRWSIASG